MMFTRALAAAAAMSVAVMAGCATADATEPPPAPSTTPTATATPSATSPTPAPPPTRTVIDKSSDDYAYGWFEGTDPDRYSDPSRSADYRAGYEAGAAALDTWESGGRDKVISRAKSDKVVKGWYRAATNTGWIDGLYSREEIAEDVCEAWVLGQPGGEDRKLAEITAEHIVDGARRVDLAAADLVDTLVGKASATSDGPNAARPAQCQPSWSTLSVMVDQDELYRLAVEEYRFQATYNWSRTQYLLGFNAGIVTAGAILAGTTTTTLSALVFGLGVVAAVLSVEVIRVQHGYYRAARDRMRRIEKASGVTELQRLDTTSRMGGRRRLASVNQLVYLLLGAIAVFDLVGLVAVLV